MTPEDALLRIANHANLAGERLPERESFLWVLWDASRTLKPPEIGPLLIDIIACLEAINREANGPAPSETIGRVDEGVLTRAAYPLSCVIAEGLQHLRDWRREPSFASAHCEALEWAIIRIAYAWSMVLAGDMDDILASLDCV